jgi:hypothetical protein
MDYPYSTQRKRWLFTADRLVSDSPALAILHVLFVLFWHSLGAAAAAARVVQSEARRQTREKSLAAIQAVRHLLENSPFSSCTLFGYR